MIDINYKLYSKRLLSKCFIMYGAIGLIVILGMLLSNKFVSHASPAQFQRTLLGVVAGYALLLCLLIMFTAFSFSSFDRNASKIAHNQLRLKQLIWARLTSFPGEIFWCYWLIGFALAQGYRLLAFGPPPWYGEEAVSAWKGILFDGTTFLAFAMIHYSLLRWLLHRELKDLELVHMPKPRFHHMTSRIAIIACCGFVYFTLRLTWYVYQGIRTGGTVSWGVFAAIAVVVISVTFIALKIAASYLLNDMKRIEDRLLQLSVGTASTMKPIAIVSPYEAGDLALAFNHLQHRFSAEYTRMQDEIQLAYSMQQQLFPPMQLQVGSWTICGKYLQEEHRLDSFFHITSHKPRHAAFIAGTINMSGPSASLVMSSLLMLFRSQVELQASGELMLQRLNQQLVNVLAEGMELHIAVVTLDAEQLSLEWVLAGQLRIKLRTSDERVKTKNGSLPLSSLITTSFSNGKHALDDLSYFQLDYGKQVMTSSEEFKFSINWTPLISGQGEVKAE